MKKYLLMSAAALIMAGVPVLAQADDVDVGADAGVSADVSDVSADVAVSTDAEVETKDQTLADGTTLRVKGEEAFVVGADGTETAAPDGTHTLLSGETVTTAGGKVVVEDEANHDEMHHDNTESSDETAAPVEN